MGTFDDLHERYESRRGHILRCPVPQETTTEAEGHRETHGHCYHDNRLASEKTVQIAGGHVEYDVPKAEREGDDGEENDKDTDTG